MFDELWQTLTRIVFGIFASVTNTGSDSESDLSRLNRGNYFAASIKNAAFPVRSYDGRLAMLLVDLEAGTFKKVSMEGSDLLSPYLSSDGARLLFVRYPKNEQRSELISCTTENLSCRSILRREGSISSPIAVGPDRFLFVSSPYVTANGRGGYVRNDFWMFRTSSEPQKLTDMQLFQLNSVSVAGDTVYFSADGARPDNPVIPRMDYNANKQSDIFKLPFDPIEGTIQNPTRPLEPLFVADGKARSPSASASGSTFAYLRSMATGNYRYDLIVRNEADNTERRYAALGLGLSLPVMVDHSAYINVVQPSEYWIYAAHPDQKDMRRLIVITDKAVRSADEIQIVVKR